MTPVDLQQHVDPIPTLSPRDILQTGEIVTRLEKIPLTHIISENALIDESHADDLAKSMRSEVKQISPITVRARLDDEGSVVYDVVDGFHRVAGMRLNEADTIDASVVYNISDTELYDLRILAASSVKSVQFARVATWMKQSFATTPWAEKGMTVTHAFGVAVNDTQRVQRVKLSPEEIEDVKVWVKESSKRWMRPITTTYENLRLVDDADPGLVKQVRYIGGGKDRTAVVTPARLRAVVNAFPGEENHAIQRAVMRIVLEHRLYAPEAAELTRQAQEIVQQGMDEESAYLALNAKLRFHDFAIVYKSEKSAHSKGKRKDSGRPSDADQVISSLRDSNRSLSASLRALQETTLPQLRNEIERLRRENTSLRTDRRVDIISGLEQQVARMQGEIAELKGQKRDLSTQNTSLRNQIDRLAAEARSSNRRQGNGASAEVSVFTSEPWYRTDPRVHDWERRAVDAMLQADVNLEEFARKNGKTVNDVVWAVRGVFDLRAKADRTPHTLKVKSAPQSAEQTSSDRATNVRESAASPRLPARPENNGHIDPKDAFSNGNAAIMVAAFFDKHDYAVKQMGLEPLDSAVSEPLYDLIPLPQPGEIQKGSPVEAQRVNALRALLSVLMLPKAEFATYAATLPEPKRKLLEYASYLRERGALGGLMQLAADEQRQLYTSSSGSSSRVAQ